MLTKEDMMAAWAMGAERAFLRPEVQEAIAEAAAVSIAQMFELLDPSAAAGLLGCAEITLQRNHKAWGLDKCVAFGRENPKYFLSQIIARAKAKVEAGARNNVVEMRTPGAQAAQESRKAGRRAG